MDSVVSISVRSISTIVRDFLKKKETKHLIIQVDQNGFVYPWGSLFPKKSYDLSNEYFILNYAQNRGEQELLYAFAMLVENRNGYRFVE